jgi:hypothetical protein
MLLARGLPASRQAAPRRCRAAPSAKPLNLAPAMQTQHRLLPIVASSPDTEEARSPLDAPQVCVRAHRMDVDLGGRPPTHPPHPAHPAPAGVGGSGAQQKTGHLPGV